MGFSLNNLCMPSFLYFILSMLSLLGALIQNMFSEDGTFCIGSAKCNMSAGKGLIFILVVLYNLLFTWFLNSLCTRGYSSIAWVIFLMPFILMAIILAFIFIAFGTIGSVHSNTATSNTVVDASGKMKTDASSNDLTQKKLLEQTSTDVLKK